VIIPVVIACDKREALAQGSTCDEAIHLSVMPRYGLLRFARNDEEGAGKSRYTTTLNRFAARVMPV
jgi:hypothetical protein